ncbi:hypothetical protein [Cellulomonas sp. ES6]|uniref:hypothetical protein n=1 Tax=Cellulomonas sp. ES6 TaxID=3039384 RepID=UPI0024B6C75F|nr:hypothetical protein [Cellulomonas sp. ES6]WHP18931.1 hypothetical protein P9841_07395 [Cellulomonas sp. ES6]
MVAISRSDIREAILDELADVEGVDRGDIDGAVGGVGGDEMYELESKTAEAVLAGVSARFGVPLPGPADLAPEQFATVDALVTLVVEKLAAGPEGDVA